MKLVLGAATEADAAAIAALRTAAGLRLTRDFGHGHWSPEIGERGVLRGIRSSRVLLLKDGGGLVATLRLQAKKPWSIDPKYFQRSRRAVYLVDMAVAPEVQRQGLGRRLLDAAKETARGWPADAIRLDAYDAPAGAGAFYAKCGFREVGRVTYRGIPLVYFELLL